MSLKKHVDDNLAAAAAILETAFTHVSDAQIIETCTRAALNGGAHLSIDIHRKPHIALEILDMCSPVDFIRRPIEMGSDFVRASDGFKHLEQRIKDAGATVDDVDPSVYSIRLLIKPAVAENAPGLAA